MINCAKNDHGKMKPTIVQGFYPPLEGADDGHRKIAARPIASKLE